MDYLITIGWRSTIAAYVAKHTIAPHKSSVMLVADTEAVATMDTPFDEGGPPVTDADFAELGLDFSKCINPSRGNRTYASGKLTG